MLQKIYGCNYQRKFFALDGFDFFVSQFSTEFLVSCVRVCYCFRIPLTYADLFLMTGEQKNSILSI